MRNMIFWDVDTQYDFMMPDGKLYVQGAENIVSNLKTLTKYARENDIQICGSVDYHLMTDPEISNRPDFHETFPPHCLQGTPGQAKIDATKPIDPLWIDNRKYDSGSLRQLIEKHHGEIVFRKQRFDVFTNPNVTAVLDVLRPTDVVVYGVALDVCDAHAIEGLLKLGSYKVHLVQDAAKAIFEEKGLELLDEWSKRGVDIIDTADVEGGVLSKKIKG